MIVLFAVSDADRTTANQAAVTHAGPYAANTFAIGTSHAGSRWWVASWRMNRSLRLAIQAALRDQVAADTVRIVEDGRRAWLAANDFELTVGGLPRRLVILN